MRKHQWSRTGTSNYTPQDLWDVITVPALGIPASATQDLKSVPEVGVHDDVIKWKVFPRYWPFVRGIHRSPVNSPHKGQWRGALMFSLICAWINRWVKQVNNRNVGDLRCNFLSLPLIPAYGAQVLRCICISLQRRYMSVMHYRRLDCMLNSFFSLTTKLL